MTEINNTENSWIELLEKYIDNTCTREEFNQLLEEIRRQADKDQLSEILKTYWEKSKDLNEYLQINWEDKFASMMKDAKAQEPEFFVEPAYRKRRLIRWVAAASILVLIAVAGYLATIKNEASKMSKREPVQKALVNDIAPGRNTAILTLGDGSVIILDSIKNGTTDSKKTSTLKKINDSLISFNTRGAIQTQVFYNTISTPRGGQYQVELPDGSKVWLNAASSLTFPTAFTGSERNVVLTGEAYFEVAKRPAMPFSVNVNRMRVEVLGTHFNVNAYLDENIFSVTLLEGSVKASHPSSTANKLNAVILKPGQQATLANNGEMKVLNNVDVNQAVAWKNGQFQFHNQDLVTIMRQFSRWYNVDVIYEGPIPKSSFTGRISRNSNALQVISMLEYAGINLRLENKRILVAP